MNTATEKIAPLSGVKGMNDILPVDAPLWERFESAVRGLARGYGYRQIATPILEHTRLFTRGIGEVTDIVEKEMYSFTDALNGEQLSLRPENTAAVVRAAIEHNLLYDGPKRLWYFGPMFRHERPQRGRYRQFHQFGIEALGFGGPDADAEIILMGQRLWDDLGLSGIRLELNSIGQPDERANHREALITYFQAHESQLDADAKRRLLTNPLRILDTKNPAMQELAEGAPKLLDYLGTASLEHFEGLKTILRQLGVPFTINPRLVRGLDYYNLTVFEWVTDALGAQGTVCGGGRYDPLVAMMGGKAAPACGFAIGVERVLELIRAQNDPGAGAQCDVYVVHQGIPARLIAFRVAEGLRTMGLDVILHCNPAGQEASFKSQMKKADASGATFAVILGDDEVAAGEASLKLMRAPDGKSGDAAAGPQRRVHLDALADAIMDALIADEPDFDEQDEDGLQKQS